MEEVNEKEQSGASLTESKNKESTSLLSEFKSFSFETIKIVIISIVVIVGIRSFIMQPFFVSGKSMEPNFHDGDYLIVNEISYRFSDPERGDVIIFHYPKDPKEFFIKRIVGLPGEKVEIRDNRVIVYSNDRPEGFALDEYLYIPTGTVTAGNYTAELKNDEYYVLGDNRSASADSRFWGALNKHFIVGKALLRAWPIDKFSVFGGIEY